MCRAGAWTKPAIGASELQGAAQAVEESLRAEAVDLARLMQRLDALEDSLDEVMESLDRYFAQHGTPHEGSGVESTETPEDALAHLHVLLAEFSGETTDYFDTVRARLSALLPAALLEQVGSHLSKYEFEEARALLSEHAAVTSVPTPDHP